MQQVLHDPRSGLVHIEQVPVPQLAAGGLLVRNAYSLISPGTERTKLNFGEKSLLQKARSRPDLVRQVIQAASREGVLAAYKKASSRLDVPEALGYSSAGIVEAVAKDVNEFSVGDRVACGGSSANHAEVIFVPANLCVKVPDDVELSDAAFTVIGAIALQGVRQAAMGFAESACVIGLGVVGIIAAQLLRASGCRVFAVDLDQRRAALARSVGIVDAFATGELDAAREITSATDGRGVDAVLVAAQSSSNQPIILASEIARDKGRIVVIGAVPMDLPRQIFYEKELDLRLSRSYGPGRYDEMYENYGLDYPYAYVRWTERRNMAAFVDGLARRQVVVGPLMSRALPLEQATQAYSFIKNDSSILSVVFEYEQRAPARFPAPVMASATVAAGAQIAVIGAGNFAQAYRLPYLKKHAQSLTTIVTRHGHHAIHLQKKWGFALADTDPARALHDAGTSAVLIATRHDNHAQLAGQAMEAGKAVFVEKPLAMDAVELAELWKRHQRFGGRLMVGYNRRFAPAAVAAKRHLGNTEPLLMHYRVNNTVLPASHWTADPAQGGGRVLGELCHFIDFFCYLANSVPVSVAAQALSGQNENLAVTVSLADGSIGTITHAVNGDLKLGKERLEAYSASRVAVIEDFNRLHLGSGSKSSTQKLAGKGHEECVGAFCRWLADDSKQLPIRADQLFLGALATVLIPEAVACGNRIDVSFERALD